jgi:cytoskeleton protein RodZ
VSDLGSLDMQDQPELDGKLPGFPGHLLRQAREEHGLSQKEAARDLHLTSKVINAIEEDDFELIPSFVFARGYIRSYARHVGLDGQALVAEFDAAYGVPDHSAKPMSGIRNGGRQSKPSDTWVKLVSAFFVLGLLAVSIVWWQGQNGNLTLPQLSSMTQQMSVDDVNALTTEDGEDGEGGEEGLDLAQLTVQGEVGATVPAADAIAEAEAKVTPTTEVNEAIEAANLQAPSVASDALVLGPNQARLVMLFEKDCWVEIKDGNGKMILSDLYSAGATIDQVVTAPIEVLLGRSSGVTSMTFDGLIIDLEPHTRKDIARLTLSK